MTGHPDRRVVPLVYACSGCSNVAQLCNNIALDLDRSGRARMSCISGVGGGVPSLVRLARSGLPILALDGCELSCVAACLGQVGIVPDEHLVLTNIGLRKRQGCDAAEEATALANALVEASLAKLSNEGSSDAVTVASPVCYRELEE
ncbi:putative zinc-binding protein [Crenobacter caeni]|uniref:Zinc-binding protein n=1 Tax=Crenobacter caeni TaxID=2705474 RepID=A0A6B2KVT3_9NEIS|nr:putative zinc-binding protein [Crenobacter caeni]NDV14014.1 zinc-binding protein [Crenobacter caeni]NDV14113.1 zinc-binding protein [Crenobacter caeni]